MTIDWEILFGKIFPIFLFLRNPLPTNNEFTT